MSSRYPQTNVQLCNLDANYNLTFYFLEKQLKEVFFQFLIVWREFVDTKVLNILPPLFLNLFNNYIIACDAFAHLTLERQSNQKLTSQMTTLNDNQQHVQFFIQIVYVGNLFNVKVLK